MKFTFTFPNGAHEEIDVSQYNPNPGGKKIIFLNGLLKKEKRSVDYETINRIYEKCKNKVLETGAPSQAAHPSLPENLDFCTIMGIKTYLDRKIASMRINPLLQRSFLLGIRSQ